MATPKKSKKAVKAKKPAGKPKAETKRAPAPPVKAPPAPAAPPAKAEPKVRRAPKGAGKGKMVAPPRAPAHPALPPFPADKLQGVAKTDELLSKHTTFRLGGPAAIHFSPANEEAVAGAVAWAKKLGIPWLVLGLGSNVLIRDKGFNGLVLKLGKGLDAVTIKGSVWKVGAGLPTPLLSRRTAEAGMSGVHRLIGVPGTVGGGVYMNAGAHGQDFATVVQSATLLLPNGQIEERPRKGIPFSYRKSGLEDAIVLGCTLKLEEDRADRLKADMGMLLKKRRAGTPFDQPCCGSVFKNPDIMTAGRLIERCGLKGRRVGGAEVSTMHANYIVNKGNATADDVLKLIDIVRTAVFKEFGVELELEVKVLGIK
jgi:UDP-N-acetylmuramate dehydrogenase